jgi:opacity protein-like surface antigen
MTHFPCILPVVAALAAIPWSSSIAADYDPPIFIDDAPEYVPVEVGSGWYLRGDVTYNVNESVYDFTLLGVETRNTPFGGSIGIGYHFNEFLRADLNLGFVSRDRFGSNDGIDFASAENSVWSGLLNGYIDLGTFAGLTPYVGAGAGLLYSSHDIEVVSPTFGVAYEDTDRQYKFAYALNAGVNYQVTNNLSVDLGYQYLNSPGLEYVDIGSGTGARGVDYHQVKLGLRYDLW